MKAAIIRVTAGFLDGDGEKFTVDNIAAALKISKKTIYKYFDGKEQLAKAVFDDIIAKTESAQKDLRAKASDARRMLIDYLILFMEIYRLNRDAVFRMYGLSESLKKHVLRAAEKNWDGFISLYEEYAPSAQTDADTLKTVIINEIIAMLIAKQAFKWAKELPENGKAPPQPPLPDGDGAPSGDNAA